MISFNVIRFVILIMILSRAKGLAAEDLNKNDPIDQIESTDQLETQNDEAFKEDLTERLIMGRRNPKNLEKSNVFYGKMNSQKNAHGNSQSRYPFQTPPIEENLHMPLSTRKQETDLMDLIEQRVPIVATLVPDQVDTVLNDAPSSRSSKRMNSSDSRKDGKKETSRVQYHSMSDKGAIIFPDDEDEEGKQVIPSQEKNKPKSSSTSAGPSSGSSTSSSIKSLPTLETTTLKTNATNGTVDVDNRILLDAQPNCASGEVYALNRCHKSA